MKLVKLISLGTS